MSEVFFVLKSVVFAILLVLGMQIQVRGKSIEHHFMTWVRESSVGLYLNKVAQGGTALVSNGTKAVSDFTSETFSKPSEGVAKASRFDFEIKRSQTKKQSSNED